ncbi:MAG: NYN domain-containing protein, partial [Acidimicrobiales bacterium]
MSKRHVVVDGSNLATEGRSLPSLAQLDTAVREYLVENPDDVVTVVVDASFGHRIEEPEREIYEAAEVAGEVTSPPAGAIGRGDAFLLRIAEKTGATVLSNDSFQEFHGEHEWLFDPGRLIGGKPVPGVGWIFTPRTPVRGPKSREAVRETKRQRLSEADAAGTTGLNMVAQRAKSRGKRVEQAIAKATEEVVQPGGSARRRRRSGEAPAEPVNEPLAFIKFIAGHPLGSEVMGSVAAFSSHGAFVDADGARCYLPLSAMGPPPPRSAREVLNKGEERSYVVQALDPLRRGVELALPGFAMLAGVPTEETVEAEISPLIVEDEEPAAELKPRPRRRRRSHAGAGAGEAGDEQQEAPTVLPVEEAPAAVAAAASAAATPAKAPARARTRRKPVGEAPTADADADAGPVVAASPGADEDVPAPPKPRSRRRPAAAPTAQAPPAEAPPVVPAEAPSAEESPQPKPRNRHRPAPKAEAAPAEAAPAEAAPAEAAPAEAVPAEAVESSAAAPSTDPPVD